MYRAGALTAIHIPTDQEEAARDLLRCREDIRTDLLRRAIGSPNSCCAMAAASPRPRRPGRNATTPGSALRRGRWPPWSRTHAAYLRTVDEVGARLHTVEQDLRALLDLEPLRARVQRLAVSVASTISPR